MKLSQTILTGLLAAGIVSFTACGRDDQRPAEGARDTTGAGISAGDQRRGAGGAEATQEGMTAQPGQQGGMTGPEGQQGQQGQQGGTNAERPPQQRQGRGADTETPVRR